MLLIAVVLGIILQLEARFQTLRLVSLSVEPASVMEDRIAWKAVSPRWERIWPELLWNERFFCEEIEKYYPVKTDLQLTGWGHFVLHVEPLKPALTLSWFNALWYVSASGRIWRANLPTNLEIRTILPPQGPVVVWGEGLPTPLATPESSRDIYVASLPIERITGWLKALDDVKWAQDAQVLIVKRTEGRNIVQLLLSAPPGAPQEVILKEDASDWRAVAGAIEKIHPNFLNNSISLLVDATYRDKIVIRSRDRK